MGIFRKYRNRFLRMKLFRTTHAKAEASWWMYGIDPTESRSLQRPYLSPLSMINSVARRLGWLIMLRLEERHVEFDDPAWDQAPLEVFRVGERS